MLQENNTCKHDIGFGFAEIFVLTNFDVVCRDLNRVWNDIQTVVFEKARRPTANEACAQPSRLQLCTMHGRFQKNVICTDVTPETWLLGLRENPLKVHCSLQPAAQSEGVQIVQTPNEEAHFQEFC